MSEPPVTQAKLVQSARYLGYERPVRYAKRVKLFQQLPFIVNTNPHIHSVYLQYFRNFEESRHHAQQQAQQQQQTWEQQQQEFIRMLARHSDTLKHIMPGIARGFYETRMYFGPRERKQFLDQLITMRIGLRLLTSQHLALYSRYRDTVDDPVADQADCDRFGGIVDSNGIDLKQFVHTCAQGVQAMCEMALGDVPRFIIDGDAGGAAFRYVPSHLEYMVIELLKNAFRASLNHQPEGNSPPPPVLITVSHGCGKVAIRIRDRGGGIPRRIHARVFDYSFTTEEAAGDQGDPTATLAAVSDGHGPFAGLGFGLPMTKIYAEYFGGSLHLISLEDYGCDVFLELPSIEPAHASQIHI
ncbi:hypothetical protein EV175_003532 [Coemansia sp. RSA 1933]|nr:hypothetical protein EV175_003532 [Coemansia sp. RSA 1933]